MKLDGVAGAVMKQNGRHWDGGKRTRKGFRDTGNRRHWNFLNEGMAYPRSHLENNATIQTSYIFVSSQSPVSSKSKELCPRPLSLHKRYPINLTALVAFLHEWQKEFHLSVFVTKYYSLTIYTLHTTDVVQIR